LRIAPWLRPTALENRAFLGRAVRYLTQEAGIRQFVDVGTGLPAQGNVHEVAHAIDPSTRVVYADHDPIVLGQSRAMPHCSRASISLSPAWSPLSEWRPDPRSYPPGEVWGLGGVGRKAF
jgi:hypothetical protein